MKKLGKETRKRFISSIILFTLILGATGVLGDMPAEADGTITLETEQALRQYTDRFLIQYREPVAAEENQAFTDRALQQTLKQKKRFSENLAAKENLQKANQLTDGAFRQMPECGVAVMAEPSEPKTAERGEVTIDGEAFVSVQLPEKVDPENYISALDQAAGDRALSVYPDYPVKLSAQEAAGEVAEKVPEALLTPDNSEEITIKQELPMDTTPDEQTDTADIQAPPSIDGPVVVALIDTGVDISHPLLMDHMLPGYDFVHNTEEVYRAVLGMDQLHGTHLAGIIAAEAPDAKIMPLKCFENEQAYTSDLIRAIQYAKDNGAHIVNCSWGSANQNPLLQNAMADSGLFFVCAAGNNRSDLAESPVYPASYHLPNSINVTSVNGDGGMSYFSNYGAAVDIAAPGRNIESAYPGGETGTMNGTSVSAGFVTGAAASYAVIHGTDGLKNALTGSADKLSCLDNKVLSGNRLNRENLLADLEGQAINLQPEEDFDVLGTSRTPSENWELFAQQDNIQVAALSNQSYFLKSNGSVWTCGNGDPVPKQVAGLSGIISMSVSDHGTLFLSSDGLVHTGPAIDGVPMVKDGLSGINLVAAGDGGQFLVAKNDGTVWGWGINYFGESGNSEVIVEDGIFIGYVSSHFPAQVTGGVSYPKRLIGGDGVSYAIDQNDTLWHWGILGRHFNDLSCSSRVLMEQVRDVSAPASTSYLGVRNNGTVFYNVTNNGPAELDTADFLDTVYLDHNMVVKSDGTVYSWDDTWNTDFAVSQVDGIDGVRMVSKSPTHTLALKNDGSVWGWGENNKGQLGSKPSDPFFSPIQIGIPVVDTPGTILVDEQYSTAGNPAYHKAQAGLESLGWSEYENPEPGGANWQSAAYGEFSAATGQLIMKKTSADTQPTGANSTALVYSLDKTFTKRTDNWQNDSRVSLWKQNFKGKYSIELEGSFPQQNSVVYYDMLGRSSGGASTIVGRYRADWMPYHQFSVYNNGLNGGGVTSYPLWQNADQIKKVTTTFDSFSSTFQTFLNGSSTPSSTTVTDAYPKDTFSMSGWNTQQPGAYLTGIRISAQKYAWQNDTVAVLNSLKLVEHQAARDVTDAAAEHLTMSMLTDTPAEVQGNLKPLPATLDGATITWSSNHPDLMTDDGTLVQGALRPTDVIMTAAITNPADGFTQHLDFRLTVTAIGGKALVEERYGDQNNAAYHLDQSGLEQLGWSEIPSPTGSNEYFQADLGEFSADSGILTMKKTGAVTEPSDASATSLIYGLQKTFTHREDNWKGDPRMSVWTQHFKGDYVVEIDGSFHQSGSQVYYDILGNSSNGTPGIAGRYRVDPGAGANFSVYNNKLNGSGVTSYPLFTNPTQRRVIATQLRSSDSTFQTFVDGSGTPCKTTIAGASPDDTFSMSGWNKANPGEYLTGIRISAQKQAPAGDVSAKLHSIRLVEAAPQRDIVDDAIDQLSMGLLTDTPEAVTEDLKPLPQELAGVPVIWRSSRPDVLSDEGKIVSEIVYDTNVTMTAQLTNPTDKFTKYVDFKLAITMKNGFAEKFDIDVTGIPSANGQPGTTSFMEYPMWTFDYPGLSSGTGGEKHDAQVLVKEGYLILKKISDRQTDSYGECLTGTRPLNRSQKNPAFRGTAQLTLTSKVQGTGTLRYTVLSDDGRKPFELILDASVKNVRIVYGSDDQGNALTQTLEIDPTVDHTYLLALDTQRGFELTIDGTSVQTEGGELLHPFLSGAQPKFNLSQLKMWITNITMADTEMGKLGSIVFREMTPWTPSPFEEAEEITTYDYVSKAPDTTTSDKYFKFTALATNDYMVDFYAQSNQYNITLFDSAYRVMDSSPELNADYSMRIGGSLVEGETYYVRVRTKTPTGYQFRVLKSSFISQPFITVGDRGFHLSGPSEVESNQISIAVFDPQNTLIYAGNMVTEDLGHYAASIGFPENPIEGTYQVYLMSTESYQPTMTTFDYGEPSDYHPIEKSVLQNKPWSFYAINSAQAQIIESVPEEGSIEETRFVLAARLNMLYNIPEAYFPFGDVIKRDCQVILCIYDRRNNNALYHMTTKVIEQQDLLAQEYVYLEAELPSDYSYYQAALFIMDGNNMYDSCNKPASHTYLLNLDGSSLVTLDLADPLSPQQMLPLNPEIKIDDSITPFEVIHSNESETIVSSSETPYMIGPEFYDDEYNLTATCNGEQFDTLIPAVNNGKVSLQLTLKNNRSYPMDGLTVQYGYGQVTELENGMPKRSEIRAYSGDLNWYFEPGDTGKVTIEFTIKTNKTVPGVNYIPLYLRVESAEGGLPLVFLYSLSTNTLHGKSFEHPFNLRHGTKFNGTLPSWGEAYFHFRAGATGYYAFSGTATDIQGEVFEAPSLDIPPINGDYNVEQRGCRMVAYLEEGQDYFIKLYNNSYETKPFTLRADYTHTNTDDYLHIKQAPNDYVSDAAEINAGVASGSISIAGTDKYSFVYHYINTEPLQGKVIAVSYKTISDVPQGLALEELGVKCVKNNGEETTIVNEDIFPEDVDSALHSGSTDDNTHMRYIRIPNNVSYRNYYLVAGIKDNPGNINASISYTITIKILDGPLFRPSDASLDSYTVSGDRNFFISSGPERILDSSLYWGAGGTYLCRAPVNGMANIYWHHLNKTDQRIYMGVLLWNRSNQSLDITMHSRNYTTLELNNGHELYTAPWTNYMRGGWANNGMMGSITGEFPEGAVDPSKTLAPGEAVWLCVYEFPAGGDPYGNHGSNGVIRLSVKNGSNYYQGQDLLCTTYAFDDINYVYSIPNNDKTSGSEASGDSTAIRGSGNGALMKYAVSDPDSSRKTITENQPFDIVLMGHGAPSVMGDRVLLSRMVDRSFQLYVGENVEDATWKTLSEYNDNPSLQVNKDILSRNANYGTVYKLYFNKLYNPEGKRIIAKVKYSPLTNSSYRTKEDDGLHIAIWRVNSDGLIDHTFTDVLTKGGGDYINGVNGDDGCYFIFDNNIPTDSSVTYYIAGRGMATMPYEFSFEIES